MARGPLEFVVVEFPGDPPGAVLAPELRRLVDQGIVRIIDVVIIKRAVDGSVTRHELGELAGSADYEALDPAIQAVAGLIAEDDIAELAESITPGSTAVALLFEHAWLTNIRTAIVEAGGEVILAERIPGPVVDAIEQVAVSSGG